MNPLPDSVPTRLLMPNVAIASVVQNIVTPPSTVSLIRLQPVPTSALTLLDRASSASPMVIVETVYSVMELRPVTQEVVSLGSHQAALHRQTFVMKLVINVLSV